MERERDNGLLVPDETTWMDGRLDITTRGLGAAGPTCPFRCGGSRFGGNGTAGRSDGYGVTGLSSVMLCYDMLALFLMNRFPSMDLYAKEVKGIA